MSEYVCVFVCVGGGRGGPWVVTLIGSEGRRGERPSHVLAGHNEKIAKGAQPSAVTGCCPATCSGRTLHTSTPNQRGGEGVINENSFNRDS